jgi:hypothetical protein
LELSNKLEEGVTALAHRKETARAVTRMIFYPNRPTKIISANRTEQTADFPTNWKIGMVSIPFPI